VRRRVDLTWMVTADILAEFQGTLAGWLRCFRSIRGRYHRALKEQAHPAATASNIKKT
jgi:hypothetical protein